MQNAHDGSRVRYQTDVDADAHLSNMLALGDTSMTDFGNNDFLLDLGDFDDAHLPSSIDPNDPSTNSFPQTQDAVGVQQTIEGTPGPNGALVNNNNNSDDEDANGAASGIGAGPLPTGFGVSLPPNTGSTLTEFTKRRNWSQRVVEEIKDCIHVLTHNGRLMYVSHSTRNLTGYEPQDLLGKLMADFVHPDDSGMFVREFNESIASGHPLRFFYRLRKADQTYAIFESHGHPHFSSDITIGFGNSAQGMSFCRGFFMTSRPYPSKNAALLDSFLEHKIENERLKKRIAEMKREEQEELHEQYNAASRPGSAAGGADKAISASLTPSAAKFGRTPLSGDSPAAVGTGPASDYNAMPPPAKPPVSNWALTQRNLDEALAASKPDSINDKMARYEGASYLEGIEMMTGLRYRDGERSKGISTGAVSPTLVRGDQGIDYPVDRSGRRASADRTRTFADSPSRAFGAGDSERKKKLKVADEYVCTDCGTLDSPEWRRGPNGPKTLCNACGLRWAKQEKKRAGQQSGGKNGGNGSTANGNGSADRQNSNGGNISSPMTTHTQSQIPSPQGTSPSMTPTMSGMPVFTGNQTGMQVTGGNMSVNIPAAQAVQGMAGAGLSPMSGISPMTQTNPMGMPLAGGAGNVMPMNAPGMPPMMNQAAVMGYPGMSGGHRDTVGGFPGPGPPGGQPTGPRRGST